MVKLTVNDEPIDYRLDPATPLLWALRDASNLTGTKYGCGTGECGACMVDVDGRALASCRVPISAVEGSFITTIEGLSSDRSHPVQLAFLADNVVHCGFCIPGVVVAAAALLRRNANPDDATIKAEIKNICRCGIYPRLIGSVQRAGRAMRGEERIPAGAAPGVDERDAARIVPALSPGR